MHKQTYSNSAEKLRMDVHDEEHFGYHQFKSRPIARVEQIMLEDGRFRNLVS